VLGERRASKPANTARLRASETIAFARKALAQVPEMLEVSQRVDHHTGRPRTLRVEVLIAAAIAAAATDSLKVHVRGIAALLRSLPVGEQRLLGVRWTDPNGGGEKLITERQVEYLFGQVARAFDITVTAHDHRFVLDHDVWSPDGEWICSTDSLTETERAETSCTSTCPHSTDAERLGNRLLGRLWEFTGIPDSDRWAVDSMVAETHFATRSHGAAADINPNYLPDSEKHRVRGKRRSRKPPGGRTVANATQKAALSLAASFRPPPSHPCSRRPPLAGPLAPGAFTRISPEFPQIAPDGRLLHTKDPGARNAFRGSGNSRPSEIVNGRDHHALVSSGRFPDGTPMPPFTRAYRATPGGDIKHAALLVLLTHAEETGVTPSIFTADRIYTISTPQDLHQPLAKRGWTLVRDLKKDQRPNRQWFAGVHYFDGWWFTSGTPTGLRDIPQPDRNATSEELTASQSQFDHRSAFAFRSNGTTSAGNLRLRGPAIPDAITRDPETGDVTAVRGVRVRCRNSPYFSLLPRTIPATTCKQDEPCGCSTTLTINTKKIPSSCEPLLWGTTRWTKEYGRRSLSESAFSQSQFHSGFDRHSIRVRAAKWDLAFAVVQLALFVQQFHSFVMRLGAHSLDPGYHSALDPEVFIPAMSRVLTPRFGKRTPSSGDPPDQ